ncbi:MAG: hypothetical protein JXQ87_18735 [Bacteroidia bacterium]
MSQVNVSAIVGIDTFSQVGSTVFGFISMYFLFKYLAIGGFSNLITFSGLTILSLLCKETGVSFLLIAFSMILYACFKKSVNVSKAITLVSIVMVLAVIYLWVRNSIGAAQPKLSEGAYGFEIGLNVFENLIGFLVALLIPISTVEVFNWYSSPEFSLLFLLIAAFSIFVFLIVVFGFKKSFSSKVFKASSYLFLLGSIPVVFLNHVSELYAYNLLPFASLLFALAVNNAITTVSKKRPLKYLVYLVLFLFLMSNYWASLSKTMLMKANGENAHKLIEGLLNYTSEFPKKSIVFLVNDINKAQYSVFIQDDFNVLNRGENYLRRASRKDLRFRIISSREIDDFRHLKRAIFLELDENDQITRITSF